MTISATNRIAPVGHVTRTIAPATPSPYRANRSAAEDLALLHDVGTLAMAWRIAMERQSGQDRFNLGHLRDKPFDIRERAGDI